MKPCTKKRFKTEIEANVRLKEIINSGDVRKEGALKRYYKCKKCNQFHFSSMSKAKFNNTKDSESRNKFSEKLFIEKETEYFNKKFGIKN